MEEGEEWEETEKDCGGEVRDFSGLSSADFGSCHSERQLKVLVAARHR
jgi:hypothetical protein